MIAIEIIVLTGVLLMIGFLIGISMERTLCADHRRRRARDLRDAMRRGRHPYDRRVPPGRR